MSVIESSINLIVLNIGRLVQESIVSMIQKANLGVIMATGNALDQTRVIGPPMDEALYIYIYIYIYIYRNNSTSGVRPYLSRYCI